MGVSSIKCILLNIGSHLGPWHSDLLLRRGLSVSLKPRENRKDYT